MTRFWIIVLLAMGCCGVSVFSQVAGETVNGIEKTVTRYLDSLDVAGISVSVIHHDTIIFQKSFGFANLESDALMTNSSVYRIWSVSKQFCAISVLKLAQEGLLKLSDPIERHLDSIPKTWKNITIRQLLGHTSGIKDYMNDFPEDKSPFSYPFDVVMDSTRILKFDPGDQWSYSNTGYWVLAKIIERVTGQSYHEYLGKSCFMPLKMYHTQKNNFSKIIENRVSGYENVNGEVKNVSRYWEERYTAEGDGELMSTLDDLTLWIRALVSGAMIEPSLLKEAWEPALYNSGARVSASSVIYYDPTASYGMGWFISEMNGEKIVWTPGAGIGFSTCLLSVPDPDLHIIVLCNDGRFLLADSIAREIATEIQK